jgi:hypothetical protein
MSRRSRAPSTSDGDRTVGGAGTGTQNGRLPAPRGRRFLRRRAAVPGAVSRAVGLTCPDCELPFQDPVAERLGFCARCKGFTGMCGAGRKIICADIMTVTSWHTPCTNLGAVAWRVTQRGGPSITLLCAGHDAEVRAGQTSWIREAVPLAD